VTVNSGATVTIRDLGTRVLTSGTVFTIINNTAATPISGTFSNLADGSTLTVGSDIYRVSYEGGTGNDLISLCSDNLCRGFLQRVGGSVAATAISSCPDSLALWKSLATQGFVVGTASVASRFAGEAPATTESNRSF
jgi:hypothetical protein